MYKIWHIIQIPAIYIPSRGMAHQWRVYNLGDLELVIFIFFFRLGLLLLLYSSQFGPSILVRFPDPIKQSPKGFFSTSTGYPKSHHGFKHDYLRKVLSFSAVCFATAMWFRPHVFEPLWLVRKPFFTVHWSHSCFISRLISIPTELPYSLELHRVGCQRGFSHAFSRSSRASCRMLQTLFDNGKPRSG